MTFLTLLQRLFALLSLVVLGCGAYLVWTWWDLRQTLETLAPGDEIRLGEWRLYLGCVLIGWSLLGSLPVRLALGRGGGDGARFKRSAGYQVSAPDGSRVYVEQAGPAEAPVLVFVHGWGMDATTWFEARQHLSNRYRLVVWDLPGLGRSKGPSDGRYNLDRFAEALTTVLDLAGRRQVILIGHSIGGMIIQTFARRFPDALGRQVVGVVFENTTHTNPLKTTWLGSLLRRLQLEPLMYLDIWLQPLVWLMNWQGYLSGSTHIAMRLGGFGVQPTRAQLEQVSLLATRNSPAVQAKGNLAMMRWDATADLSRLTIPALVFIGGRDLVTRPEAGLAIADLAPGAHAQMMPTAGHMGPMECAEAYNSAIERFADEVFARSAQSAVATQASDTPHRPAPSRRTHGDDDHRAL